jgi:dolichyl-phosphate beta-glucosyltransferase
LELSVVIPAYNEERVIQGTIAQVCRYLEGRYTYELLLVDDGSTDATAELVRGMVESYPALRPLENGQNQGKGYSIAHGIAQSRGDLVFYTDADLVYALEGLEDAVGKIRDGYDVAIGSRVHPGSTYSMHPHHFPYIFQRHIVGRTFIWVVRHLLGLEVTDTQCSFKLWKGEVARAIFSRLTVLTFAFEVEALLIAQRWHHRIAEIPVHLLYLGEPSSVILARDSLRMLRDLLRIWWLDRAGRYAPAGETPTSAGWRR